MIFRKARRKKAGSGGEIIPPFPTNKFTKLLSVDFDKAWNPSKDDQGMPLSYSAASASTTAGKDGGKGLLLNGAGYMVATDSGYINLNGEFKIELSFYQTDATGWRTLFCKPANAGTGFVAIQGGKLFINGDNGKYILSNDQQAVTIMPNTWYDLRIERDASNTMRVYLNNVMSVELPNVVDNFCGPIKVSAAPFYFGTHVTSTFIEFFKGYIDNISIMSKVNGFDFEKSVSYPENTYGSAYPIASKSGAKQRSPYELLVGVGYITLFPMEPAKTGKRCVEFFFDRSEYNLIGFARQGEPGSFPSYDHRMGVGWHMVTIDYDANSWAIDNQVKGPIPANCDIAAYGSGSMQIIMNRGNVSGRNPAAGYQWM